MNVGDAIQSKRAVRQFQDKPLPDEVVEAIVNAGRLSGSAKNRQPWSFVLVRERATLNQLATCGAFAGHLAGAALDVFDTEPPTDWTLAQDGRAIATPHTGGFTKESVDRAVRAAVDNLLEALREAKAEG